MTYIFDFDGTLVDSMPAYAQNMLRLVNEVGLGDAKDVIKIVTPLGYKGAAEYLRTIGMEMEIDEFIKTATTRVAYEYENNIPAKPYVKEKLVELKANGHSLNVLTASPHSVLDVCLKRLGMFDLFDNVWSCEDFNMTKADPQIYHEAAKKLGKKVEECSFIDDNINAVTAAKKANMISIAVYDESSKDFIEEMKAATDRYIFDFREL